MMTLMAPGSTGRALDLDQLTAQVGRMTFGAVGARSFIRLDESTLQFTISRGHRATFIRLEGNNTYTVQTAMRRTGRVVFERSNVYCDQIASAIWDAHIEG